MAIRIRDRNVVVIPPYTIPPHHPTIDDPFGTCDEWQKLQRRRAQMRVVDDDDDDVGGTTATATEWKSSRYRYEDSPDRHDEVVVVVVIVPRGCHAYTWTAVVVKRRCARGE